jgi:hypothetical protein
MDTEAKIDQKKPWYSLSWIRNCQIVDAVKSLLDESDPKELKNTAVLAIIANSCYLCDKSMTDKLDISPNTLILMLALLAGGFGYWGFTKYTDWKSNNSIPNITPPPAL